MSASIFDLKNITPNDAMLAQELGIALVWFNQIQYFIEKHFGSISLEWKYYGQKSGWVIKLFHEKRNVLFVVPLHGSFKVVLTVGEKAFNLIIESDITSEIKHELLNAPKYAEGRTIQLHINSSEQLQPIFELIRFKLDT